MSVTGAVQIGPSVGAVHKFGAGIMAWPGAFDYWSNGGILTISGLLTTALLRRQPVLSAIAVTYGATLDLGGYIVHSGSVYLANGVIDLREAAVGVKRTELLLRAQSAEPMHRQPAGDVAIAMKPLAKPTVPAEQLARKTSAGKNVKR